MPCPIAWQGIENAREGGNGRLENDPRNRGLAQPLGKSAKSCGRVLEALCRTIFQSESVRMGFRNPSHRCKQRMPGNGRHQCYDLSSSPCPMLVMHGSITRIHPRQIAAQSPVGQWLRPLVKTAVDQTPKRSITTQLFAIQPPPLPTMDSVVGVLRTSLIPQEPQSG